MKPPCSAVRDAQTSSARLKMTRAKPATDLKHGLMGGVREYWTSQIAVFEFTLHAKFQNEKGSASILLARFGILPKCSWSARRGE